MKFLNYPKAQAAAAETGVTRLRNLRRTGGIRVDFAKFESASTQFDTIDGGWMPRVDSNHD